MHAIEEAKGCMQKGKYFNRLQAKSVGISLPVEFVSCLLDC